MCWMGWKRWGLLLGLVLALGLSFPAVAQTPVDPIAPRSTLAEELQSLASRAAVVFVGQVVSIHRAGGVVEVGFRVEQSLSGAVGDSFILREWAGLWPAGLARYVLGERALVFLHAPSTAGFASPVDGANGLVPVVVQGADAPELLDIRRLAAAIVRAPGTPLPTEADGAIFLTEAVPVIHAALHAHAGLGSKRLAPPQRLPLPLRGVSTPFPVISTPSGNEAVSLTHVGAGQIGSMYAPR